MSKKQTIDIGVRTMKSSVYHLNKKYNNDELSRELSEEIEVHVFQSPHAFVGLKRGITINTGNWESVRLDFSLSIPCYPEEIGSAYKFAEKFLDEKMEEEVDAIRGVRPNTENKILELSEISDSKDQGKKNKSELSTQSEEHMKKEGIGRPRRGRPRKVRDVPVAVPSNTDDAKPIDQVVPDVDEKELF